MKKIIISTVSLVFLTGCSNKMQRTIGLTESAPDEFQVKSSKPLEVPPHYNLNEPRSAAIWSKLDH